MCQHKTQGVYCDYPREITDSVQVLVDEGVIWPWRRWLWVLGVLFCIFLTLASEAAWAQIKLF